MEPEPKTVRALEEISGAFRSLFLPPFGTLLLLSLLISLVTVSIAARLVPKSPDDLLLLGQTSMFVLDALGIYVQIAIVLAAASPDPDRSADLWMRAAFKHRCFWRFLGGTILEVFLVVLGAAVFVVGAFFVGGIVALTQAAIILERRTPGMALRRSAELTTGARRQVAIVFAVLLLFPLVAGALAVLVPLDLAFAGQVALTVGGSILSLAAAIALTRVFVKLGGKPSPPVQALVYKSAGRL